MDDDTPIDWEAAHRDGHIESPLDQHVIDLAPTLTAGTSLDMGCGAGQNSIWLAERGWAVTGVDIAPSAIAAAKEAAANASVDATFLVGDTREWTTSDEFSFVFSTYALPQKGPGRTHALATAVGSVARGGTLLITEFDVSMTDEGGGWSPADLIDLSELKPHLDGFEILDLSVVRTRHAHGHDEQNYPIAVAVARRPA
ncbi:MAG: class I SAM-dependent methyltransferase [Acidimicrobiia bacterium]